MRITPFTVIIIFIFFTFPLLGRTQQGPFISLFYYPGSYSTPGRIPYNNEPIGTTDSKVESGKEFSSLSKLNITGGYFYGIFMGQLSYSANSAKNILPDQSDYTEDAVELQLNTIDITAGLRLSPYGDSSYSYVYAGYKRIDITSDYIGLEVAGNGITLGYTGFYSFNFGWPIEPALYLNVYFGNYPNSDYRAENVEGEVTHLQSYTAGSTIGIGILYEPYEITLLGLASYESDQISHNTAISDGYADFGIRHTGTYFGFGIMYQYLNFKYNR
jgi:hypothetical protein